MANDEKFDEPIEQGGEMLELCCGSQPTCVAAQAAYTWDIEAGVLSWDHGARDVFNLSAERLPRTTKQLNALIVDAHVKRRHEAIHDADARNIELGVPYQTFYRIMPGGYRSSAEIWVEEAGRWWPGLDDKPARARGYVRVGDDVTKAALGRSLNDYDEMTGQLNRLRLMDALSSVVEVADAEDSTAALFLLSIEEMQLINDNFGYRIGDEVVAEVGRRLTGAMRGGDTLGRYSANKFGLIISNCSADTVPLIAQRFINGVRAEPIRSEGCSIVPTLAIGVTMLNAPGLTVDTVVGQALRALDNARNESDSTFAIYARDTSGDLKRKRRAKIGEDVGKAIDDDRLKIVLQPIVNLKTLEASFFECLLRIREPSEFLMSAADFIPVAERLGLAGHIDRRTLHLAMGLLREHPQLCLSLNVSALTCTDSRWLRELAEGVELTPEVAPRLTVEITETMTATDLDEASYFVDALKDFGCRVAIDDFGAGHTSFASLRRLDADVLKIDGQFVRDMVRNPRDRALVKAMINLAHDLGMGTVAEWVSDQETADLLTDLGADHVQGFHFGKPMELEQLIGSRYWRAVCTTEAG